MTTSHRIAIHLRQVFFGGNWTASNLKDQVADISWEDSLLRHGDFNTIATLFYHITYYSPTVIKVLEGGPLEGTDKESLIHTPIRNQQDWEGMQTRAWEEAEKLASLIELMPDEQWSKHFTHEKYGSYYRNVMGLIEHAHYHLGQIVVVKKMLRSFEV